MDVRQSSLYTSYLKKIGWQIEKIGKWYIFIRKIPFWGKIAKLQKIKKPIPFSEIEEFVRKEKIKILTVEPDEPENNFLTAQFLAHGYRISKSPFLPTKTIKIDLSRSYEEIFHSFSSAKRRAVRKAVKNRIHVRESADIENFIKLKTVYFPFLGFFLKKEFRHLWQIFHPKNASLLLAYHHYYNYSTPIAGVLLLFWNKKAYYWQAASKKEGNRLAAPSLLVFEALKLSKKRGCTIFDFEGIYDPRFHHETKNWQGFSRFKGGFGGRELSYIGCFILN